MYQLHDTILHIIMLHFTEKKESYNVTQLPLQGKPHETKGIHETNCNLATQGAILALFFSKRS